MGSEGNKMNDVTSFQQASEPAPCANGCGFFGSAATMNLCSKCYRDVRVKEEQAASAKSAMEKVMHKSQPAIEFFAGPSAPGNESESSKIVSGSVNQKVSNRCGCCKKRVGVIGFTCRCGITFCGSHRYPEQHDCAFDFKGVGREAIAKANPVVKADKIERL